MDKKSLFFKNDTRPLPDPEVEEPSHRKVVRVSSVLP
jgi:hypothetical protein